MKGKTQPSQAAPLQPTTISSHDFPDISPASDKWEAYTNFLLENFLSELNLQHHLSGGPSAGSASETVLDPRYDRVLSPDGTLSPDEEENWPTVRLLGRTSEPAPAPAGVSGGPATAAGGIFTWRALWILALTVLILMTTLLLVPWPGPFATAEPGHEEMTPDHRLAAEKLYTFLPVVATRPHRRQQPSRGVRPESDPLPPAASPPPVIGGRLAPPASGAGSPIDNTDNEAVESSRPEMTATGPPGDIPAGCADPREQRETAGLAVVTPLSPAEISPPPHGDECPVGEPAPDTPRSVIPPLEPDRSTERSITPEVAATGHLQGDTTAAGGPVVPISECTRRPVLIEEVRPVRPWNARQMNKKGRAVVRVLIAETGAVEAATLILERPTGFGFGTAALAAARQCRYEPARQQGSAVKVWDTLVFDFR
jgi:TonB family protein